MYHAQQPHFELMRVSNICLYLFYIFCTGTSTPAPAAAAGATNADDEATGPRFSLGGKRQVVVKRYRGKPYVNIREYYQAENSGKLLAGKKGINLTGDQWQELFKQAKRIHASLASVSKQ